MPSLEVLKQEQAKAEVLLKEDVNISIEIGLVDLAARIDIQIKLLEFSSSNWVIESIFVM